MTERSYVSSQQPDWASLPAASIGSRLPLIAMAMDLLDLIARSQGTGDLRPWLRPMTAADMNGFAAKLSNFGQGLTSGEQVVLANLLQRVIAASAADPTRRF